MKFSKLELPIAISLAIMLLYCAAATQPTPQWWRTAFSPLCGSILNKGASNGVVVKSKLIELLA